MEIQGNKSLCTMVAISDGRRSVEKMGSGMGIGDGGGDGESPLPNPRVLLSQGGKAHSDA